MSRYLYLVRHGEQQDAQHGLPDGPLSPRGVRQARALAERLGGVPFDAAWHSPLERAEETARIMTDRMPALVSQPTNLLFDCYPSGPTPDMPHAWASFFGGVTRAEIEAGEAQMADAASEFLTADAGDSHELLITHNFVIGWFAREVLGAPSWRWLGLNVANAALTVIRVRSAKPPVLLTFNDMGHLPAELRTGLPVEPWY